MWQIHELTVTIWQHNATPQVSSHCLTAPSFSFISFYFFPQRIYHADKHTLLSCSASLVKQGSDWMMPGCRYSALPKSIFPTAALVHASFLLSLAVLFPLFLSSWTCLASGSSFSGCWEEHVFFFLHYTLWLCSVFLHSKKDNRSCFIKIKCKCECDASMQKKRLLLCNKKSKVHSVKPSGK